MHFFKNLPVEAYIRLLKRAACLVGNSSSGIREGSFIGTPAVNVGSRQDMRERGRNVLNANHDATAIAGAIRRQLDHGAYAPDPIYGDGTAGERIAATLADCEFRIQKRITY
jgi:UDP-N-acetylglucosamine 2-epimerase